jgi:hypothetical protein
VEDVSAILSWLLGGGISAIGKELRLAHEAKLKAANDSERIAAEVRIKELEARQSSILAAQSDRYERWVRIGFALPFVIYIWKLLVWDKVLGMGTTDPLSPMLTEVFWIVLGGYFFFWTAKAIRK